MKNLQKLIVEKPKIDDSSLDEDNNSIVTDFKIAGQLSHLNNQTLAVIHS